MMFKINMFSAHLQNTLPLCCLMWVCANALNMQSGNKHILIYSVFISPYIHACSFKVNNKNHALNAHCIFKIKQFCLFSIMDTYTSKHVLVLYHTNCLPFYKNIIGSLAHKPCRFIPSTFSLHKDSCYFINQNSWRSATRNSSPFVWKYSIRNQHYRRHRDL